MRDKGFGNTKLEQRGRTKATKSLECRVFFLDEITGTHSGQYKIRKHFKTLFFHHVSTPAAHEREVFQQNWRRILDDRFKNQQKKYPGLRFKALDRVSPHLREAVATSTNNSSPPSGQSRRTPAFSSHYTCAVHDSSGLNEFRHIADCSSLLWLTQDPPLTSSTISCLVWWHVGYCFEGWRHTQTCEGRTHTLYVLLVWILLKRP